MEMSKDGDILSFKTILYTNHKMDLDSFFIQVILTLDVVYQIWCKSVGNCCQRSNYKNSGLSKSIACIILPQLLDEVRKSFNLELGKSLLKLFTKSDDIMADLTEHFI